LFHGVFLWLRGSSIDHPQPKLAAYYATHFGFLANQFFSRNESEKIFCLPFLLLHGLTLHQGDQIRRIFSHWAIVFSVYFFENYRSGPKCVGFFFPR
jgi:hypothetical protein